MKIEIKNWITEEVIFSHEQENNSTKITLELAVRLKITLQYADMQGADMHSANMLGAERNGKILNWFIGINIYKYFVFCYKTDKGNFIEMGCKRLNIDEWNKNFWNNEKEFPNNGNVESERRKIAFEICLKWFELNEKKCEQCNGEGLQAELI